MAAVILVVAFLPGLTLADGGHASATGRATGTVQALDLTDKAPFKGGQDRARGRGERDQFGQVTTQGVDDSCTIESWMRGYDSSSIIEFASDMYCNTWFTRLWIKHEIQVSPIEQESWTTVKSYTATACWYKSSCSTGWRTYDIGTASYSRKVRLVVTYGTTFASGGPRYLMWYYNTKGWPYPRVNGPNGSVIPFPAGPYNCNNNPGNQDKFRSDLLAIYQARSWSVPYMAEAHHIKPKSFCGTDDALMNGVFLDPWTHRRYTDWWTYFKPWWTDTTD